MKKIITGYADVDIAGGNGEKLLDSMVEVAIDILGAKVEVIEDGVDAEPCETCPYKVTVTVEKVK